jgi:hypothetical protein
MIDAAKIIIDELSIIFPLLINAKSKLTKATGPLVLPTSCSVQLSSLHQDIMAATEARDVPINIGSQSAPVSAPADFQGRGGTWVCEKCNTGKLLPSNTKNWSCQNCKTKNYTLPHAECPLDTFCPCCCWDTILTK